MNDRQIDRRAGDRWLPTVLLTLALGAGFASVGHAETTLGTTTATARAAEAAGALELRDTMRSEAGDAASQTRASVAADLDARLRGQHRALRLASRNQGKRG